MATMVEGGFQFDDRPSENTKAIRSIRSRPRTPKIFVQWDGEILRLRPYQIIYLRILYLENAPLDKGYLLRVVDRYGGNTPDYQGSQYTIRDIGIANPKARETSENHIGYPSLITLGLVKCKFHNIEGQKTALYEITEAGIPIARYIEDKYKEMEESNGSSNTVS